MDVCCGNCRFGHFDQEGGACKRYPPTVILANVMTGSGPKTAPVGVYPPVRLSDQCGEWKVKIILSGSPLPD